MELFCEYFSSSERRVYAKFKKWLAAAQFSFPLAVILSVSFHAVILIFLFLSAVISSPTGKDLEKSKRRAIYEALKEETNLSVGQGKKIAELLKGFDVSGADLDENEKVQLFKRLIGSYLQEKGAETEDEIPQEITREDILSSLQQSGGIALGSGKKVFPSVSPKGKQDAQLNALPKPVIKDIRSLQKFPTKDMEYYITKENVWVNSPAGVKIVPSQYFFRESPFEQILAQGVHLFHIAEGFPALEGYPPSDSDSIDSGADKRTVDQPREKDTGFKVFLISGESHRRLEAFSPRDKEKEELVLDESFMESFNRFCDEFLVLPEDEQFMYFKRKYLDRYDLNDKNLAYLTRRFIHNNLNNIIIPISTVSSAFDYVEELYFNKPLECLFLRFWEENPGTMVGGEILLTLASQYDFERRAVGYLYEAYEEAKSYLSRKYKVSEVFNKKAKCYVVDRMFESLKEKIEIRGYSSLEEVSGKYLEEQIEIYDLIIREGGESRNPGLYDLGCLYWDFGLHGLAVAAWTQIDEAYETETLEYIREALTWLDDVEKLYPHIDRILSWSVNQGIEKRFKRLLDLGKWKARGNAIWR